MTEDMTRGGWRFAAAKRTGTSHAQTGLPCQDAFRCEVDKSPRSQVLISVVSDGAGSASEGAKGAAYICDGLMQRIQRTLPAFTAMTASDLLSACVLETRESLLQEADLLGLPARELAGTLLCAVLAEDWSAFAQVGDGAIVTPESGTRDWAWLFWPQRGEYANTTCFLTDPTAVDVLQVETLKHPQDEVALFTDGLQHLVLHYEEQTVHSPFFERMMRPVRQSTEDGEDGELSIQLQTYLGSRTVTSRADDDLTLVMASRVVVDESDGGATS